MKHKLGKIKTNKLKMFHDEFYKICRNETPFNFIKKLNQGDLDHYFTGNSVLIDETVDLKEINHSQDDLEVAIQLYDSLGDLSRLEASDARLWTYLCCFVYRDYVIDRGSLAAPDKKKEAIEKNMMFLSNSFTRNVTNYLSRLWWGVHMTIDLNRDDKYFYTKRLFELTQIRQSITERKSIYMDTRLTRILLDFIQDKSKDSAIRVLSKLILNHQKTMVFDNLEDHEVLEVLNSYYNHGVQLNYIRD